MWSPGCNKAAVKTGGGGGGILTNRPFKKYRRVCSLEIRYREGSIPLRILPKFYKITIQYPYPYPIPVPLQDFLN